MEKITKRKMKVKYVEVQSDEFEEVVEYKTLDGKIFYNEYDAQKHEDRINYPNIKKIQYLGLEIGDTWYCAENKDEIELLQRRCNSYGKVDESIDNIKPGEWFTIKYDYGGDSYPDIHTFITLKEFLDDVDNLKEMLNS